LIELLQKMRAQKGLGRQISLPKRGNLKDVPRYLQQIYLEQYGWSLAVTIKAAEAVLCVHNRHGGCKLTFPVREHDTNLAAVVQEVFANVGLQEATRRKVKIITAPLPHLWLEAAQIVQTLIRGYGAAENAELVFYSVWKGRKGGTPLGGSDEC
jgi:hypothetical protein